MSSMLPKNEPKVLVFGPRPTRAELFRSFFGRIEKTKNSFQNKLTFRILKIIKLKLWDIDNENYF